MESITKNTNLLGMHELARIYLFNVNVQPIIVWFYKLIATF